MEHGKEICKHSTTLTELAMRQFFMELLGKDYTAQDIREHFDKITVGAYGKYSPSFKQSDDMSLDI